eukprot:gnl/TRDRNA2_/TRDRNA2_135629_c1_seq1.p2 gnl/TRDRNA2_/TRDRNA2_135629_c1~~gnl/TRDRNA2_/TRDRNA2_135629_c1_seq1.p2  ORF type:complete len:219 (+),score=50.90 gnl/TRDRNA2_/TRDRNA2_135629_c1_seq1:137-793(+)
MEVEDVDIPQWQAILSNKKVKSEAKELRERINVKDIAAECAAAPHFVTDVAGLAIVFNKIESLRSFFSFVRSAKLETEGLILLREASGFPERPRSSFQPSVKIWVQLQLGNKIFKSVITTLNAKPVVVEIELHVERFDAESNKSQLLTSLETGGFDWPLTLPPSRGGRQAGVQAWDGALGNLETQITELLQEHTKVEDTKKAKGKAGKARKRNTIKKK